MLSSSKKSTGTNNGESWLAEEPRSYANLDVAIIIIIIMLFFSVWALGVSPFENPLLFLMAVIVFLIVVTLRWGVAKALFGGLRRTPVQDL